MLKGSLRDKSAKKSTAARQKEPEPYRRAANITVYLTGRVCQYAHAMKTACNGNLSHKARGLMSG